jgi:hypothetical protein
MKEYKEENYQKAFTNEEKEIMDDLLNAWNKYVKLEQYHPDEKKEFTIHIHSLQEKIAFRILVRQGIFPKK